MDTDSKTESQRAEVLKVLIDHRHCEGCGRALRPSKAVKVTGLTITPNPNNPTQVGVGTKQIYVCFACYEESEKAKQQKPKIVNPFQKKTI